MVRIIKYLEGLFVQRRVHVGFLDGNQGLADVVQCREVRGRLNRVNLERDVYLESLSYNEYLDVGRTLWEDDLKSEVLCNDGVEVMIEGVVEHISSIILISEEVVTGGNIVALAPVGLPLPHNWESRLNSKTNLVIISEGI